MVRYYTADFGNKQLQGEYEHTCVFELKSMMYIAGASLRLMDH